MSGQGAVEGAALLALAYLALSARGSEPDEGSLAAEALRARALLSERGLAARTVAAVPLLCTVKSVELEESSQRYVVTFRADRADADETVRSDRLDGAAGERVRRMWSGAAGRRAVIYKLNENAGRDQRAGRGYRVAPYVRFLR